VLDASGPSPSTVPAAGGGRSVAPIGDQAAPVATPTSDLPSSGRGFDEDEIRIGYLTWNEVSTAGSAVGVAVVATRRR
jgi:hypothetical protein